jgi:hypothetical protein
MRECGNGDCGWTGETDRMLGAVGPLCPECGEVTEPAGHEERLAEVSATPIPQRGKDEHSMRKKTGEEP